MKNLHNWNLSYKEAADLQERLARRVRLTPVRKMPKLVAGLDCAFSKDGREIIAAVIVLQLPPDNVIPASSSVIPAKPVLPALRSLAVYGEVGSKVEGAGIHFDIVETATVVQKVTFPYIPGLLSFREAPACIAAVAKLKTKPDTFIIDGQGIAHPRRFGIASHLGLFFDKPTIGCAKSRLIGDYEEPFLEKGVYSLLMVPSHEPRLSAVASAKAEVTGHEVIGAVLRTRKAVNPVFVSVGNKCTLDDAIKIILACTTKYRIPEPTRLAHQLVSREKTLK
jgi:deoxyribonuclease V